MTADAPSSVTKALRLLAHLAVAKEPVALADISRSLKLPKPTTYRLARSIEDAGFVHKTLSRAAITWERRSRRSHSTRFVTAPDARGGGC